MRKEQSSRSLTIIRRAVSAKSTSPVAFKHDGLIRKFYSNKIKNFINMSVNLYMSRETKQNGTKVGSNVTAKLSSKSQNERPNRSSVIFSTSHNDIEEQRVKC